MNAADIKGENNPQIVSTDTLILFLLTVAGFIKWDLLANPLAPPGSILAKVPQPFVPLVRLFLPAEGAALFSPYRWMLVSLAVLSLLIYLVLDVIKNLEGGEAKLSFSTKFENFVYWAKFVIIIFITMVIVLLPALQQISRRHSSGRLWEFSNDNVIQTEEAIKFVLAGKNPYSENYLHTPMVKFQQNVKNPALYHFVYMPSDILFSIPFYLLSRKLIGWYDQRFIYLSLFIFLLWLVSRFAQKKEKKLTLITIFALNPFMAPFVVEGRNDVFTLFWIVLSIYFLLQRRNSLSVAALAIAVTHKLFAVILLPFYWLYLLQPRSYSWSDVSQSLWKEKGRVGIFILVSGAILLPFIIWDFRSFFDDIWLYGAGRTFMSMSIEGPTTFGVGTLILYTGAVKSIHDYFPFWILQLVSGLPLLVYFLLKQARTKSVGILILGYTVVLFAVLFFSRFFHDNYLGLIVALLAWVSLGDFSLLQTRGEKA